MDQIRALIEIGRQYNFGGVYIFYADGKPIEYTNYNEHNDEHYRICYDAATNFINSSLVFSKLSPKEIIKVFANMEFIDNRIFVNKNITVLFTHEMVIYCNDNLKLFEELLRINQEMLVAIIKAIDAKTITCTNLYYLANTLTGTVGARQVADDNYMISLYKKLLEHNYFDVENLNLPNIISEIRPTRTKSV